MEQKITKDSNIATIEWTGYKFLGKVFSKMKHKKSGENSKNFPEMCRIIIHLQVMLRALRHYRGDLQNYINEYSCRFNLS